MKNETAMEVALAKASTEKTIEGSKTNANTHTDTNLNQNSEVEVKEQENNVEVRNIPNNYEAEAAVTTTESSVEAMNLGKEPESTPIETEMENKLEDSETKGKDEEEEKESVHMKQEEVEFSEEVISKEDKENVVKEVKEKDLVADKNEGKTSAPVSLGLKMPVLHENENESENAGDKPQVSFPPKESELVLKPEVETSASKTLHDQNGEINDVSEDENARADLDTSSTTVEPSLSVCGLDDVKTPETAPEMSDNMEVDIQETDSGRLPPVEDEPIPGIYNKNSSPTEAIKDSSSPLQLDPVVGADSSNTSSKPKGAGDDDTGKETVTVQTVEAEAEKVDSTKEDASNLETRSRLPSGSNETNEKSPEKLSIELPTKTHNTDVNNDESNMEVDRSGTPEEAKAAQPEPRNNTDSKQSSNLENKAPQKMVKGFVSPEHSIEHILLTQVTYEKYLADVKRLVSAGKLAEGKFEGVFKDVQEFNSSLSKFLDMFNMVDLTKPSLRASNALLAKWKAFLKLENTKPAKAFGEELIDAGLEQLRLKIPAILKFKEQIVALDQYLTIEKDQYFPKICKTVKGAKMGEVGGKRKRDDSIKSDWRTTENTAPKKKLFVNTGKENSKEVGVNTEISKPKSVKNGPTATGDAAMTVSKPKSPTNSDGLKMIVITNDGNEQNLIWLISVKEIFAVQLPRMPKEYIVRLVMDRKHYSLLCIKAGEVVGGICFRPYLEQRFAEIAFCAVSASHQVKGYGTILMNHLKQYVKTIGLTHFLTYADNYAIGYFKKQGFTKQLTMHPDRWMGYIKDYDGGTLMECAINPCIDYLNIAQMLKSQKQFLMNKIKSMSKSNIVYPGLNLFKEGRVVNNIYEEVPGVFQAGWTAPVSNAREMTSLGQDHELQRCLQDFLRKVTAHKEAWPFHEPVPDSVTDYLEVVHDPVDLSLIKKRLSHGGYYKSVQNMVTDLRQMCDNCRIYNQKDTQYYQAADLLQAFFDPLGKEAEEQLAARKMG
mmetsp:Transcript_11546/g.15052  ORF Transcript_11546/g.15052 Transcript_11546/m.15052 type:complete len:999 (-) Transcript_11546:451-3447(-)|eukprot:CAMPEP_0204876206 /NCGR_PEP_ID=MMETSP1348-20121228/47507_1 /ASSEMBLY_ACC=CAM_ASM_000700 /TAXON_ID=215587 /ORGANISM="Aplanochytrium stocchinoi, Strain GSBS06" /LENGTH=998 /DNA_ID=CAMNT_0052032937 /DNA_START=68 /DNA_END=3064 /DNA_ORIENTATION=+